MKCQICGHPLPGDRQYYCSDIPGCFARCDAQQTAGEPVSENRSGSVTPAEPQRDETASAQ